MAPFDRLRVTDFRVEVFSLLQWFSIALLSLSKYILLPFYYSKTLELMGRCVMALHYEKPLELTDEYAIQYYVTLLQIDKGISYKTEIIKAALK